LVFGLEPGVELRARLTTTLDEEFFRSTPEAFFA
jgi:hypothetical protein